MLPGDVQVNRVRAIIQADHASGPQCHITERRFPNSAITLDDALSVFEGALRAAGFMGPHEILEVVDREA